MQPLTSAFIENNLHKFVTVRLFVFVRGTKRMRVSATNEVEAHAVCAINGFHPPYDEVSQQAFGVPTTYECRGR
jgi:hypothetical protein